MSSIPSPTSLTDAYKIAELHAIATRASRSGVEFAAKGYHQIEEDVIHLHSCRVHRMVCADEVVHSMRGRVEQPISVLARRVRAP